MESIGEAFASWTPFWQGVFVLIVLSGLATAWSKLIDAVLVVFRGYPPKHVMDAEVEKKKLES